MKFNIVNEIKLSYSRKGNSEKLVGSSRDAADVFRQHFDHDEMDYRKSFFCPIFKSNSQGFRDKKNF